MNRIEQTYFIEASPEQVWEALTDPEVISQWSSAPAVFVPEPGNAYSLWGGDIGGSVVEVVPQERLVQTWKPKDWTVEDSVVTFTLAPSEGGTLVHLIHENVQDWDYEGTNEGWNIYYLGEIKKSLERSKLPKKATAAKKAPAKKKPASKKAASKKKPTAKKTAAAKKKSTRKR
jgi:uncharacterized protein YndB with AHSA1/START domain